MHSFFGLRYQDTIQSIYDRRKIRTLGLVRSSHALASPYPYVLYSDLYDHRQFIRAVANAGFSGLLWCPEVRDAKDSEDLIRRLQTVIFSPLAMVNAWYIKNPPWKQVDRETNNADRFQAGWETLEAHCRTLIETRMRLVPYLYSAFVRYRLEGVPPFRALVVDYPHDPQVWTVDDEYLAGDSLLVAPVVAGQERRSVYLPTGKWFDYWTGKAFEGGKTMELTVPLETIPVFVKEGTLLPLAEATLHTSDPNNYKLTVRGYGTGDLACVLHEDDGSPDATFTSVTLRWPATSSAGTLERSGRRREPAYTVDHWERM
jgi:alpha-D-xyloside xylohydrolase